MYWDLTPDEYAEIRRTVHRQTALDKYETVIWKWLQGSPDFMSSQITDWLKEHYPVEEFEDRTVRRFVAKLRE